MADMSDRQPSDMVDLSGWPTKAEGAARIGISERTLDRLLKTNPTAIQKRSRPRPGLPPVDVLHPGDVEKERARRKGPEGALQPHVMPAGDRLPVPNSDTDVRQKSDTEHLGALVPLLAALQSALNVRTKPSELRHKRYLTEAEAMAYTGLGKGNLRKMARGLRIGPRRAKVYRREDLDKL